MTLRIQQLSFERNLHYLFRDIHFELKKGELLQVSGANGSGKSTLLRILAGLLEYTEGNIEWQQQSIRTNQEDYQQQIHYIGHQNGIKHNLTVAENIQFIAALMQSQTNQSLLKQVKLNHVADHLTNQLSAGQKRRLALVRLLLKPASLWILDEPTNALDQAGQQLFFDLLTHHLALGGMAIVTSHHALPESFVSQHIFLGENDVS